MSADVSAIPINKINDDTHFTYHDLSLYGVTFLVSSLLIIDHKYSTILVTIILLQQFETF